MVDSDLARLYGVDTRALVQAVKRNIGRFPADFMFPLTGKEVTDLRSQSVISKSALLGRLDLQKRPNDLDIAGFSDRNPNPSPFDIFFRRT